MRRSAIVYCRRTPLASETFSSTRVIPEITPSTCSKRPSWQPTRRDRSAPPGGRPRSVTCCCARGRRARRPHRVAAPRDRWESPGKRERERPRAWRPGEGRAGREAERAEELREEELARHAEVLVWPAARSRVTAARPRHSPCAATRDPLRPGARPPPWAVEDRASLGERPRAGRT